jgi:phosphatidylglycerol:prolipoprotein diacylglycerol transferase
MVFIYWDPNPALFTLPIVNQPVLWYGILFALGFALGFPIFVGILCRFLGKEEKKKAVQITDRLTAYLVVGTVVGARLGHFLFYEQPAKYLKDPLEFFRIWKGGLASHGAALGIILSTLFFSYRIRATTPTLNWIKILDFVCVPTALAAFFIRIGNFINQEILGTPSNLPWAVLFAHPSPRCALIPRHPVQIYEALFYLAVFFLLYRLTFIKKFLFAQGKLLALFLILIFGFRFGIEFLKLEQSRLLFTSCLTMGQFLSIPAILFGLTLYYKSLRKN